MNISLRLTFFRRNRDLQVDIDLEAAGRFIVPDFENLRNIIILALTRISICF